MRRNNQLNAIEREHARPAVHDGGDRTIIDCLRLFLNDARTRNVRPATLRYYEREILLFARITNANYVSEITPEVIKKAIQSMLDDGLKVVTVNTRLRAVRAFFNHLYAYKVIQKNPVNNLQLLRDREPIIETYSTTQMRKLLAACDLTTFVGLRDYTLLYLFYDTGVRLSEMVGIDVDDIHFPEGIIKIRSTKNGFERYVPLQRTLARQLKSWLKVRGIADGPALFLTLDGERLTARQIQNRVTYYGNQAGITTVRNSPHTLRHTFGKTYIQNGGGAFDLMRIMGHETMDMTKRYVRLFGTELTEKHREHSPLENLYREK